MPFEGGAIAPHTYTCFSCRFWSWMHVLHYSWFTDVKLWLNQGMSFSSIGFRHLLWHLGQSLGIWSHKCSPLFICGVNLRRYKIYKSFSTMPFIQQLFKYKTFTEPGTSRESGRSDSAKCVYMAAWGFLGAGAQEWLVSKALSKLKQAVFLDDFTIEGRAILLW